MEAQEKPAPEAVVIDLGKHGRKRVKALRKGRGRLMTEVRTAVDELRRSGVLAADAQIAVVVVERRGAAALPLIPGLTR